MREQERITTLPGVFATISAGFDLTARHLWLLFLPVVLDVFYWLGPRLRFQTLIEQLLEMLPVEAEVIDLAAQLGEVAPQTNLFTSVTVQLIGVPALMVGLSPETTPLAAQIFDVDNWTGWFGLFAIFSIAGLLLTALFYSTIAYAISNQTPQLKQLDIGQWGKRVLTSWVRLLGLALMFLIVVAILYIPLIIVGTILFMINGALGSIALIIGPFLVAWIVMAICMAPFGIVLNGRPLLPAVVESLRLVQKHLPSVIYLLFTVFLIGAILDWLLFAVENGTWLTIVNIFCHAFVSTALVAAIFIYYSDRYTAMFVPDPASEIRSLQDNQQ